MSSSQSLPSQEEILAAFAAPADSTKNSGRQLLWQAIQYGLGSESNSTEVVKLLSGLLRSSSSSIKLEEHIADAFWLASSSLAEEDSAQKPNAAKANVMKDESATKPGAEAAAAKPAAKEDEAKPTTNGSKTGDAASNKSSGRDGLVHILQGLLGTGKGSNDDDNDQDGAMASKKRSLMMELQSLLDPVLLEKAGTVVSEKDLMKKLRMLNTKNYRQHKFNLLQEESEGFSKALEALVRRDYGSLKSIMGTFHVDPNRVLDLALDVMIEEHNLSNDTPPPTSSAAGSSKSSTNLYWLKDYSIAKMPALVAFKLQHAADSAPNTQRILQTIAYIAIQDPTLLPLSRMAAYLEPVSPLLAETFSLYTQMERKRVRSVGRVRLGGSSAAQQKEEERDAQNLTKLTALRKDLEKTHRIQLLKILLQQHQWKLVQILIPDPEEIQQILTLIDGLGLAVCDWIQEQLAPMFDKYCSSPEGLSQATVDHHADRNTEAGVADKMSVEQVVELISGPLLCSFESKCIVQRPTLFCQLCRLLRALLAEEHSSKEDSVAPSPTLYTFMQSFILPALSLFNPNPSLAMEVWSVLQLFPYTTRYQLYRDWRGIGLERDGLQLFGDRKKPLGLVEAEMHAGKDARYCLKRLSMETLKEACRSVAKVAHSNPLVMFTTILNQIESYDNLVSVMVDALRFVTPLGLDVLGFCMLSRLCGSASSEGDRKRSKGMTIMTCRRQGRMTQHSHAIRYFDDYAPRQYTIHSMS